jgi:hypothetical protein
MCLSVAYWLRVQDDILIRIDLSIFNLDQPSAEPILRFTRVVPQSSAGQLLAEYFVHVTTSVCSGQPSHIILFHYHSQSLQVPNHLLHLLTPSYTQLTIPSSSDQHHHRRGLRSRYGYLQSRILVPSYPGFTLFPYHQFIYYQPIFIIINLPRYT